MSGNTQSTSYRLGFEKRSTSEIDFLVNNEKSLKTSRYSEFERLANFPAYVTRQTMANFLFHYEIFKRVVEVPGSVVECGVAYGGNLMGFAQLSAILEPTNYTRRIVGFDTFAGFPDLDPDKDAVGKSEHAKKGGMAVDAKQELETRIQLFDQNRFLNHIPKVELVQGDICETIPQYLKANPHLVVSLLYVDMDIYKPTKVVLEHLVPRMPKGAVIAFDELNHPNWPGETVAVMEELGIGSLRLKRMQFDTTRSYAIIGD
ncbi:MAG: TylF/MycF/NovP-related O-methyltransferase [Bdellovibrionota bacterium]